MTESSYVNVKSTNHLRFELVHLPDSKKPWFATAYGDPLPRTGLASYGTTPWDAISNAAIGAANFEYHLMKSEAKKRPVGPAEVAIVKKRKKDQR